MNIFVTDQCPYKSAKYLDDKRVISQTKESAQMLATAIRLCGGPATYKVAHPNHPCSIWVRQTRGNYIWLLEHFEALLREYTKRTGKIHACEQFILEFEYGVQFIPQGLQTPFVNAAARSDMGISYKHIDDTILAYKMYLSERWSLDKKEPKWSDDETNN